MSQMLEQAIIDAKALRESAMQNAETQILEKYSEEVKSAVKQLLEQDPDAEDPLADAEAEDDLATTMEQVPMAHLASSDEEEVVVDLDDIIAAADDEEIEIEDAEAAALDRSEIADEVGIGLDNEPPDVAANRSDEFDIDEGALVDMFKEMLVIDVDEETDLKAEAYAEDEELEEDEEDFYVASVRDDGMTSDDIEESDRETERLEMMESIKDQNIKLKTLLEKAKNRLIEVNISNARLLYANKVHQNSSLNEQQKEKIANLISEASTADEAKMIYTTLQKTMQGTDLRRAPQSLSEAVSKRSSVILSSRPREESAGKAPELNRWALLAGLTEK